jgi:hypothetical protein
MVVYDKTGCKNHFSCFSVAAAADIKGSPPRHRATQGEGQVPFFGKGARSWEQAVSHVADSVLASASHAHWTQENDRESSSVRRSGDKQDASLGVQNAPETGAMRAKALRTQQTP